ncbi:hypothetical protein R5W23_004375 [Gemmata sp. JC673]|uniref:Uncharacterized protein n=1 Tax=Gemmata algarum TaxID=2975278 RepID=A0ABU5F6S5_9BACT|nr:hypothetical protein [Gemmata algarum]MDY3562894.1 hypothetical protein [Gemmata algarum]
MEDKIGRKMAQKTKDGYRRQVGHKKAQRARKKTKAEGRLAAKKHKGHKREQKAKIEERVQKHCSGLRLRFPFVPFVLFCGQFSSVFVFAFLLCPLCFFVTKLL